MVDIRASLTDKANASVLNALARIEEAENKRLFKELAIAGPIVDNAQRKATIRAVADTIRTNLKSLRESGLGAKAYRKAAENLLDRWERMIASTYTLKDDAALQKTLKRILKSFRAEVAKDAQTGTQTTRKGLAQEALAQSIADQVKQLPLMNLMDAAMALMGKKLVSERINTKLAGAFGKLGFGKAVMAQRGLTGGLPTLDIEQVNAQQEAAATKATEQKEQRQTQLAAMRKTQDDAYELQKAKRAKAKEKEKAQDTAPEPRRGATDVPDTSDDTSTEPARKPRAAGKKSAGGGQAIDDGMIVESLFMIYDVLDKNINKTLYEIWSFLVDDSADRARELMAQRQQEKLDAEAARKESVAPMALLEKKEDDTEKDKTPKRSIIEDAGSIVGNLLGSFLGGGAFFGGGKLLGGARRLFSRGGTKVAAEAGTKIVGKEAAEVGAKVVGKEAVEVGTKFAGKEAAKVGAKTLGKSALKKIPLLGAAAGLAFGVNRLMSGDMTGALGEVASGLVSIVPGIGTAASLAIDAGLAARDIKNELDKTDETVSQVEDRADTATEAINEPTSTTPTPVRNQTRGILIGNEPFDAAKGLSPLQRSVVEAGLAMGTNYPSEVMEAYAKTTPTVAPTAPAVTRAAGPVSSGTAAINTATAAAPIVIAPSNQTVSTINNSSTNYMPVPYPIAPRNPDEVLHALFSVNHF